MLMCLSRCQALKWRWPIIRVVANSHQLDNSVEQLPDPVAKTVVLWKDVRVLIDINKVSIEYLLDT